MGFLSVLTLTFIVLKLTGQLAWSWFWVLSPLLVHLVPYCVIFLIVVLRARRY
jgi:hypothetical protein